MVALRALIDQDLNLLWFWLESDRHLNFDDYGPRTYPEFHDSMQARTSEYLLGVTVNDQLAGFIGYLPVTDRLGMFHGICIAPEFRGQGVGRQAVSLVFDELFSHGVEKIQACFFAHNKAIHLFLDSLGFIWEGTLHRQTVQNGIPTDMMMMAKFKGD